MIEDREAADGKSEGDRWIAFSACARGEKIEYETDLSLSFNIVDRLSLSLSLSSSLVALIYSLSVFRSQQNDVLL